MKDTAKKVLKTGYGIGLLSLAQAKKAAANVKKELGLDQKESTKLAKELVASSRKASEEVLKTVGKHFEKAVVKSGLAKKGELRVVKNTLKRRVKKVLKKGRSSARKKVKTKRTAIKKRVKKVLKKGKKSVKKRMPGRKK